MIRYLLDEHIPPTYRAQLLRLEPSLEVWMIGDAGAPVKGTLDPEILCWCETHRFILVTNNRKSMPGHLADHLTQGHHVPGILAVRRKAAMVEVMEHLVLIAGASLDGEYQDTIRYIPLH